MTALAFVFVLVLVVVDAKLSLRLLYRRPRAGIGFRVYQALSNAWVTGPSMPIGRCGG